MSKSAFQRQADPVSVGWSIGHAPLALRGIRFIEGEAGAAPAAPAPSSAQAPAAPNPSQLAAFYAAQHGGQAPTAVPAAPVAPAAPAPIQGFTPEQVQKLMEETTAAQQALAQMQTERDEARTERDSFKGQVAEHARVGAITTAADGKANTALLLDSARFQAAVKDIDLADAAALGAAIDQFVQDNPAYAAAPTGSQLPHTSGGTPAGGTNDKPKTLQGAIAAHLGG